MQNALRLVAATFVVAGPGHREDGFAVEQVVMEKASARSSRSVQR
jgi:hypothetical protein